MEEFWQLLLHADERISDIIAQYGTLTYIIVFSIIFIETGLVVVAFFPGDGLLFTCGILASSGELNLALLLLLLTLATFLGNTSNYLIGKYMGLNFFRKIKATENKHLGAANLFFEKHKGKAIVFSRYIPFMRSFIPFVAGITKMNFAWYSLLNFIGAILWIFTYVLLGYFLGEIPIVKQYYGLVLTLVLFIIIAASVFNLIRWIYRNRSESIFKL